MREGDSSHHDAGFLLLREPGADPGGVEALFQQTLPTLVAFIRKRAGGVVVSRESAADIAQSVCREALQDLGGFQFRGVARFRSWLFRRAIRKIFNRQRWLTRERRDVRRELATPEVDSAVLRGACADPATPSQQMLSQEEIRRVEAALQHLPDAQREAILLTRVAERSYQEAAARLGRTESAVRGLVMRGLARLAGILEGVEPDR